jgi:hypothetical protein
MALLLLYFTFIDAIDFIVFIILSLAQDRLCGLDVRDPGYRYRDPDSIPGTTRFSEL